METFAAYTAIPGATPRASRLRPLRLPATQVYHRSGILADARLEAPVEAVLESGENWSLCSILLTSLVQIFLSQVTTVTGDISPTFSDQAEVYDFCVSGE